MAKLSISSAAKATGKARTTIQSHIKKGLISVDLDSSGKKLIDVSELQRFYGKVNLDATGTTLHRSVVLQQFATPNNAVSVQSKEAVLNREIELLRQQLDEAKEREKKLLGLVEKQTNLLEHHQQKKRFWKVF